MLLQTEDLRSVYVTRCDTMWHYVTHAVAGTSGTSGSVDMCWQRRSLPQLVAQANHRARPLQLPNCCRRLSKRSCSRRCWPWHILTHPQLVNLKQRLWGSHSASSWVRKIAERLCYLWQDCHSCWKAVGDSNIHNLFHNQCTGSILPSCLDLYFLHLSQQLKHKQPVAIPGCSACERTKCHLRRLPRLLPHLLTTWGVGWWTVRLFRTCFECFQVRWKCSSTWWLIAIHAVLCSAGEVSPLSKSKYEN